MILIFHFILPEAVRCDKFASYPITDLDKISENFVRRAGGRLKNKESSNE